MATRVEQQTVDYESLNKNDKDLKNLIKEIDDLKDADLDNDKIEGGVLLENNLNKSLDKTLRHCDKKILNALVTEVGKINLSKGDVEGLNTLVAALNTIKVSRETESLAKFRTKITSGQLDDLNHLDKEDIQNVLDCIDGMSRSDALKLYSDMTVALQSQHNNFKSTDQKYFYSVYEIIENKVNNGKPLQLNESDVTDAELREIFYDGLQASRLGEIFKQYIGTDWEGGNINGDFVLKKSETQRFTAKEFADKFNEANGKRIEGVNTEVNKLINRANIDGITVNDDGTFKKGDQNITIEAILGITDKSIIGAQGADGKDLNILNITELKGEHFADKRTGWTKALTERINKAKSDAEAAANAEWKSIEEGQKSSYMDETRINLLNKISFNDKFLRYNTETKDYSYNLNNAKKYLDSLKDKDWTQYFRPLLIYHDRYGNNFENKTDNSDSLAWIAAVQILLNNLPGREGAADKLKVDGKLGTETQEKIKAFQSSEKMDNPDGKPGKNTITKLLSKFPETGESGVQSLIQSGDNNEHTLLNQENENQNTFQRIERGFQINDVSNKVDFGIDRLTPSYKKDGEGNNLYYQSGNDIVRVSTDTPWIKQKQTPNDGALDDNKWTSDVNVCKEGETKLNDVLQTLGINGAKITKSTDNNQYVFENGNTKIMLGENILTKDFCGKTNIADKMKVVYFASVLGSKGVNFENDNQINNYLMGEYLADWNKLNIHDDNANEFVHFYKGGGGPIIGNGPIITN